MKLQIFFSLKLLLYFFLPVFLVQPQLLAQPVNPQPGENIWHLTAGIGTEVDQLALQQNNCCVGTFTVLNIIESKIDAIVINSSCDLSGTYTLLNTAITQELTIESKVDALTNIVNEDFAGTFTAIAAISGGSCDLSGTYTVLQTLGLCNATPLTLTSAGTTITTAGVYCLTNDVNLGANTLLISASNVVLDLNQRTIAGTSSTGIIQLNNSAQFCTIQNGILVGTSSAVGISSASPNVNDNLNINNIKIANVGTGIQLNTCTNSVFANIYIENFANGGIAIGSITGGRSNNLTFNNCILFGALSAVNGFTILDISSVGSTGLTFNNCFADTVGNGFAVTGYDGAYYNCQASNVSIAYAHDNNSVTTTGRTILFENCAAKAVSAVGFFARFNAAESTGSVVFKNCSEQGGSTAFSVITSPRTVLSGCTAVGATISLGNSTNGVIENCSVVNSTTTGFQITAVTSCIIRGCSAAGCTNEGFQLGNATNGCEITGCTAAACTTGFQIGNATSCTITGCTASKCIVGFQELSGTSNIWYANGATQNTTSYLGITSPPSAPQVLFAAGVYGANLADVLP